MIKLVTKKCKFCDVDFEVKKSEVRRGNGKYCSRGCYIKDIPNRPSKKPMVDFNCKQCGEDFSRATSTVRKQLKKGDSIKYCSVECLNKSKKVDHGDIECINCNQIFKKNYPEQKYCSQRCSRTHSTSIKDFTPNLRDRIKILDRDNYTCQYCGLSPRNSDNVILEIDHIVPRSKGGSNDVTNLITSCCYCNGGKGDFILSYYKRL